MEDLSTHTRSSSMSSSIDTSSTPEILVARTQTITRVRVHVSDTTEIVNLTPREWDVLRPVLEDLRSNEQNHLHEDSQAQSSNQSQTIIKPADASPKANNSNSQDPSDSQPRTQNKATQTEPITAMQKLYSPTISVSFSDLVGKKPNNNRSSSRLNNDSKNLAPPPPVPGPPHPSPLRSNPLRSKHIPITTPYDTYGPSCSLASLTNSNKSKSQDQPSTPIPPSQAYLPPNPHPSIRPLQQIDYTHPPTMSQLAYDHARAGEQIIIQHDSERHLRARLLREQREREKKKRKERERNKGKRPSMVGALVDRGVGLVGRMGLRSPTSFRDLRHFQ